MVLGTALFIKSCPIFYMMYGNCWELEDSWNVNKNWLLNFLPLIMSQSNPKHPNKIYPIQNNMPKLKIKVVSVTELCLKWLLDGTGIILLYINYEWFIENSCIKKTNHTNNVLLECVFPPRADWMNEFVKWFICKTLPLFAIRVSDFSCRFEYFGFEIRPQPKKLQIFF